MFNTIEPLGNWIQFFFLGYKQTTKVQHTSWVTVAAHAHTVVLHKHDVWHVNTYISPWGLNEGFASPHGCCGVGAPAALAQLLEIEEFDWACRMNREMAPVNAYMMKWYVCSVERTPLSQSSKVSWVSLYLHWNKPFPRSKCTHGIRLWLTSSPWRADMTTKAALQYPHRLTRGTSHISRVCVGHSQPQCDNG